MANVTSKQFISNNRTRVNNHIVHVTNNNIYLQSYDSIVVRINKRTQRVTLGIDWSYSMTTKKYVKQFIEQYTSTAYSTKELHDTFKVENLSVK